MVGRFKDISGYRDIFQSKDFFRILLGGVLIPIGYYLSRLNFPDIGITGISSGTLVLNTMLLLSIAINGLPIITEAVQGIFRKKINVDELVSIAIIACLFTGEYLEAALISLIMVLGSFIEEGISDRARNFIENFMEVNPRTALIEENGRQVIKKIDEVKADDIAVIKAGDTVPVDGEVIEGSGSIDESLLTGESFPVFKGPGNTLSAGTLNLDGYIKLKVKRTGDDSTLGRIIQLISNAENSKVSSAGIVDRFAVYFTPAVLSVAVLTFLITRDSDRAIAVLVVGCPCSFLLAGPVSTVVAIGRAAKSNILIKGGVCLEKLARSESFLFDKTGTITAGKPVITAIRPSLNYTEKALIELASAVEQGSTHPIAEAIIRRGAELKIQDLRAHDITVIPGFGVKGFVGNKAVSVSAGESSRSAGETTVQVTVDGKSAGTINLFDKARPGIAAMVERLTELGAKKIAILSGDSRAAVQRIANETGIPTCYYRLKPEEKIKTIEETSGHNAVFVGDGMNDAPSLKRASVGIAMGLRGAEMALETSDIILMNDSISLIPFLVRLGRRMTSIIKLDIAVSILINVIAVILSSMGILSPIAGAVTHNIGSVLVVMMSASIALIKET